MDLLKNVLLTWRQFRHFNAAMAELGNRSDHELAERGIARGDIVRVAYAKAEQRVATSLAARRAAPAARGAEFAPAR
jgi:uncharacterized protein YjiS (DUF1127 family)